jgi:hypothetical protein
VECEQFVNAVRQVARKHNLTRQNAIVADRVQGCFFGDALRWHISLDDEIKGDWRRLEQELIAAFPAPKERSFQDITEYAYGEQSPSTYRRTLSDIIPIAAVATTPPPAPSLSRSCNENEVLRIIPDGYYIIRNQQTNSTLDDFAFGTSQGSKIGAWSFNNGINQHVSLLLP